MEFGREKCGGGLLDLWRGEFLHVTRILQRDNSFQCMKRDVREGVLWCGGEPRREGKILLTKIDCS